jgi:hypothetical protein
MPAITRPAKAFSFASYVQNNPRGPLPGDRLDAQIQNLIEAIHSTQQALAEIRRDDGRLVNESVALEQLAPVVRQAFTQDVIAHTQLAATRAEQGAALVGAAEDNIALLAGDAEAAAFSAAEFLNAVNLARKAVDQDRNGVAVLADTIDAQTTDAENWANYSQANAENAVAAKDQALQWAEYLAGPVVDAEAAPAYIAGTPFPHGLYYQPVEGYGGNAGLWSAKWWAIYAAQLVGPWGFYYLGGWQTPPVPGEVNPDTGIKVPAPIPPGSFYYDITTGTIYVWNGSAWTSPYALASGVVSRFVYLASAGQTVFSGADYNGAAPNVGASPSDVHLNGVRLVENLDFVIDTAGSALTLTAPVSINSIVQWDLLVPTDDLIPGAVHTFKVVMTPPAPDGVTTQFMMQYLHPVHGLQPVAVTDGVQLQVSIDGVIQEPGGDYVALRNVLTMGAAPVAAAHFWAVWFSNAVLTS